MSTRVSADPGSLRRLSESLRTIGDQQSAGIDALRTHAARTGIALEQALMQWEREFERSRLALVACEAAAAAAAATGTSWDCSAQRHKHDVARRQRDLVKETITAVARERDTFNAAATRHIRYLSAEVERMRTGLHKRAASLEDYLAWRAGSAAADSAPKFPLGGTETQSVHGVRGIPLPVEAREAPPSKEREP